MVCEITKFNPPVTWLLPVKNGMPYLTETLASIEAQTYKHWEILVWDNGSTDGTIEELKKWIPARLPGRLIIDRPLDLGESLARMVEICETELCARIDADDINLPERLEKQLEFLADCPETAVLGSWIYAIDQQGSTKDLQTRPLAHDDIIHQMLTQNVLVHPSVILRKSAILAAGNYRNLNYIEDLDLWLRIARSHKLRNIDIPLIKYRIHNHSTTKLAIKHNRLDRAVNNCLSEHALLTYGCTEDDMSLLQARNHPLAIRPILQIAQYLQKNQGGELLSRWQSRSFIQSAKNLLSPRDIPSRLAIAGLSKISSINIPDCLKKSGI